MIVERMAFAVLPSQPSWAAWIEIYSLRSATSETGSQPSWAAWIEMIIPVLGLYAVCMSQPSWAAWIEMATRADQGR